MNPGDKQTKHNQLLTNIKSRLPELTALYNEMCEHWQYEDPLYRFYYQSYKVYYLQNNTQRIVSALRSLSPADQSLPLNATFGEIIAAGASGVQFELSHNEHWTMHTRPFVEAFFHAKYFLEMIVKYGQELDATPEMLPSGWAAVLCLYNIR